MSLILLETGGAYRLFLGREGDMTGLRSVKQSLIRQRLHRLFVEFGLQDVIASSMCVVEAM
jgi:hypothetical protein